MKHTLIFATHNLHKLAEVRTIVDGSVDIQSLTDIGFSHLVLEETQATLEGNAEQKVRIAHAQISNDCFAEDAGLEVDALDGRPGVFTGRFAGPDASAEQNIAKLLNEMSDHENRRACFRTILALMLGNEFHLFEGIVEGTIARQIQGTSGFGYDPVFIPDGHQQTFAELSADIKNTLSHRAMALRKMLEFLKERERVARD